MLQLTATYQRSLLVPIFIFLLSGALAISMQQPFWMLVPFAWILFPPVFIYTITHTEQLFWLVLIALPLSTELNITPSLGLDFPDEVLLMLLTGITLVKLAHQPSWFPRPVITSPLFALLVIYMLWLVVTCIYSAEPLLSVKYTLAKTWYIIPLVILPPVLLSSKERLQKMALCLLVPMLLLVIQTLVRHSFYSFSFENVGKTLFPFFRNHVNYSSMLVCLLPVAWCFHKLMPAGHPLKKWVVYSMAIGVAGLLFAYSRGAWIALPAGIFMGWVIRKRLAGALLMVSVTALLISVAWLVTDKNFMRFIPDHDHTVFHTGFGEHMLATIEGKDVSSAERLYRWVAGAQMLAEKPITGFGPNSFYPHYRPFTVNRFQTWVSDNPEHSTVHNYFLLVALEQGIPGLLLFCLLYSAMLLAIQRLYHKLQSRFYQTIALTTGCILAMIAVINSMSDMIETDKIGSLFWLCLGVIILLEERLREEKIVIV